MKKVIKSRIFLVIIITIIVTSVSVYAATTYKATDVVYKASDGTSMNVNEALNELYDKINNNCDNEDGRNIIVASWINELYTASLSWTIFKPTLYDSKYFDLNSESKLVFKESGNYKIYYQSASDGGASRYASIRILVNSTEVAQCTSNYARCRSEEVSYTSYFKNGDVIEIAGKTNNSDTGARVIATIVKIVNNS